MLRIYCYLLFSGLLLGCSSGQEDEVKYRLTSKQRQRVDSLVEHQLTLIRPRIDSICTAKFDSMLVAKTDSIVQRRLEEEARLRTRISMTRNRQ